MRFRVSLMVHYRYSGICQPITWLVPAKSGDDAIDTALVRTFDKCDPVRAIASIEVVNIQRKEQ